MASDATLQMLLRLGIVLSLLTTLTLHAPIPRRRDQR